MNIYNILVFVCFALILGQSQATFSLIHDGLYQMGQLTGETTLRGLGVAENAVQGAIDIHKKFGLIPKIIPEDKGKISVAAKGEISEVIAGIPEVTTENNS